MHKDIKDNLLARISKSSKCWVWTGYIHPKDGYGRFGLRGKSFASMAHRLVYELYNNCLIDKEMTIDHLCLNKTCVNPKHLEVVTRSENSRRARLNRPQGEHCARGHKLKAVNWASQKRVCHICHMTKQRERRQALRMA